MYKSSFFLLIAVFLMHRALFSIWLICVQIWWKLQYVENVPKWSQQCELGINQVSSNTGQDIAALESSIHHHQSLYESMCQAYTEIHSTSKKLLYQLDHLVQVTNTSSLQSSSASSHDDPSRKQHVSELSNPSFFMSHTMLLSDNISKNDELTDWWTNWLEHCIRGMSDIGSIEIEFSSMVLFKRIVSIVIFFETTWHNIIILSIDGWIGGWMSCLLLPPEHNVTMFKSQIPGCPHIKKLRSAVSLLDGYFFSLASLHQSLTCHFYLTVAWNSTIKYLLGLGQVACLPFLFGVQDFIQSDKIKEVLSESLVITTRFQLTDAHSEVIKDIDRTWIPQLSVRNWMLCTN